MKSLVKAIGVVLLSSTLVFANNDKEEKTESSYEMGMYFDGSHQVIKTFFEKSSQNTLKVSIKSAKGKVLATKYVPKKAETASIHFDVSQLPDGNYIVETTDGDTTKSKALTLGTTEPTRVMTAK